jgi:hypothetical protein
LQDPIGDAIRVDDVVVKIFGHLEFGIPLVFGRAPPGGSQRTFRIRLAQPK